ncbi:MAG: hypothetical protein AB7H43_00270 [Acidimicrobiia bacterium]
MAEALLMEFDPQDGKDARQEYATVMTELALGDEIPAGAISHAAVVSAAGGLVVFELWESRVAQERFMEDRLAAALERAGASDPVRVEWFEVVGTVNAPPG